MLKLITLPPRPYKNFDQFVFEERNLGGTKKSIEYPCFKCCGHGNVWDPAGYDVYEGNKLNTKIVCPKCKGTGNTTREEYLKIYNTLIANWKRDRERDLKKRNLQKSGLGKLNAAEKAALFEGY